MPVVPASIPPVASLTQGVWLKGDWHMHSRHSTDSTNNPQGKIIGFAERLGFDYIAITDHTRDLAMARGSDEKRRGSPRQNEENPVLEPSSGEIRE